MPSSFDHPEAEGQFLSADHWIGELNSDSGEFLTAIEAYRGDPSLLNLIPSLRRFVGMGDILYFRRPGEVAEGKFTELAQHYNSAAEILTGFLLPSAEDQGQLRLQEEYGGEEWGRRLQEHFAAAAELDGRLGQAGIAEQDRAHLASLGAARLIRLGQMIFFKIPEEFQPQGPGFQKFFMQAMSQYLDRLDGLLAPSSTELSEASEFGEAVDYSMVELSPEAEAWWQKIEEMSGHYLHESDIERSLVKLREASSSLTHLQKEAILHRLFQKDGWMWKRINRGVEKKNDFQTIGVPALFEALGVDQPVKKDMAELLAKYVCGPGGVLDLGAKGMFYEPDPGRHFPPAGVKFFAGFAYLEYRATLEAGLGEEGAKAEKMVDNLWVNFGRLKDGVSSEYLGTLQKVAREFCPRMVSAALEQNPYYQAWETIGSFVYEDRFGKFTREEFEEVFAAMVRHRFGLSLLREPEKTGKDKLEFRGPLDLITNDGEYSTGVFGRKKFGQYLSESQRLQFFEAVCGEEAVWPEGEGLTNDVLQTINNMVFYDQAEYGKLSQKIRFDHWKTMVELMPTREALGREIARRRALVERELLINLAMTGELPVHSPEIDGLVNSAEAREAVEATQKLARETVQQWRAETRREEMGPNEAAESRAGLFFGREQLKAIFGRRFTTNSSVWGGHTAERFLAAATTAESREELMAQVEFVRERNIGNFPKLDVSGRIKRRDEEQPLLFVFSEPPDQEIFADAELVIAGDSEHGLLTELRQIVEETVDAAAGSYLAGVHDRLNDFVESRLAGQLDNALGEEGGDGSDRAKKILGLLGNQAMEPVREAIRDLAMLKMFADGSGEFGAGRIELTEGKLGFDGVYPPLLVGEGVAGVSPYSVAEEGALTVVVGPNGGGKTMLISALAAAEAMALTGTAPLAETVRIARDAEGVPLMLIGAATTTGVSRFDNSVRQVKAIDEGLAAASSVTLDEAFPGTGDFYRGHLQVALALKAVAQGRPVRLTTHQTETFYHDLAVLGAVDGLEGLGIEGRTQWLSVDVYHRVMPGRISPFGIEMAAGAGFPTVIAENAKKLRDAFASGTAIKMEAIKPRLEEEGKMPEWVSRETLLRLGINGMWKEGYGGYTGLAAGEGDVLGCLYDIFRYKRSSHKNVWREELWFRRTMTRFMQQLESRQDWEERVAALRQYAGEETDLERDAGDCERYTDLLDSFMIVDQYGNLRDEKLDAEGFFRSQTDKSVWQQSEGYDGQLEWRDLPPTLRRVRQGRMTLAAEAAGLAKELKTVSRVSGVAAAADDLRRLGGVMEEVRTEQRKEAAAVLTKAISAQAAAAVGGFYGDVSQKSGYNSLRQVLQAAGRELKDPKAYFKGYDIKYFLQSAWKEGNYRLPMEVLRCFGGLVDGGEKIDWHRLFDGSWETELKQFPMGKAKNLDVGATIADLGRGESGRLAEMFEWMESKDLPAETKKRYREQYPLTMTLFGLYQQALDADFVQRWEDKLRGENQKEREELIGALERATVNLVLGSGLRQSEETHLVFTEISPGQEVEMEEAYNPGMLQAGIKEVPQTLNWVSGQAMVISGPNTGGKTSLAKKVMVAAPLHKAAGIGMGKRIRLPSPESIGGLYASINAAETRMGEGNLASEARDVGRFLGDYLTAGCPQGVWFFGDELFTGTGQADQAGLLGATVDAITASGGRCMVTTNEDGIIRSLDQAGISHADVRFSYRDPETQFVPLPGVGGAESFQVARDLGLDPRLVDLAERLGQAQRELEAIRSSKT